AARGLLLDWRNHPAKLARFDVVVASDVLYERPYGALVARVLDATLAPRGLAVIADPGRVGRTEFVRALGPLGLRVVSQTDVVVSAEVAGIVVGDGESLAFRGLQRHARILQQSLDERGVVNDFIVSAELRKLIAQLMEAVWAAGDDRLHLVAIERADGVLGE